MSDSETKKIYPFQLLHRRLQGVEQYLNRQAAKGWKLDKVGVLLGRFIWAERDDLRWCVDLADPKREREEEEDYLGLCCRRWLGPGGQDQQHVPVLLPARPAARTSPDRPGAGAEELL